MELTLTITLEERNILLSLIDDAMKSPNFARKCNVRRQFGIDLPRQINDLIAKVQGAECI